MDDVYKVINSRTNIEKNIKVKLWLSDVLKVIGTYPKLLADFLLHAFGFLKPIGFDDKIHNNYPVVINDIIISKFSNRYTVYFMLNKTIENILGVEIFSRDRNNLKFMVQVTKAELENMMIALIPFIID